MFNKVLVPVDVTMKKDTERCCQTNENSHQIAGAALIYALNSWRGAVRRMRTHIGLLAQL